MRNNKIEKCLKKVIEDFKNNKNDNKYGGVIPVVLKSKDIEEAIKRAFRSKDKNRIMEQHQHRVGKKVLCKAYKKFIKLGLTAELENCKDFEYIYNLVRQAKVTRFGELAIYDVALRIALFKKIEPELVYLSGWRTKEAYRILANKKRSPATIDKSKIFNVITNSKLKPFEIEIVLCLFSECYYKQLKF